MPRVGYSRKSPKKLRKKLVLNRETVRRLFRDDHSISAQTRTISCGACSNHHCAGIGRYNQVAQ